MRLVGNASERFAVDALDEGLGDRFPVRHVRPKAVGIEHQADDVGRGPRPGSATSWPKKRGAPALAVSMFQWRSITTAG